MFQFFIFGEVKDLIWLKIEEINNVSKFDKN
jgi:hypothetical protein